MSRKKIIAGNWKMNLNYAEAMALADAVSDGADQLGISEVILAPPFVFLHDVVSRIQRHPFFAVAAQNCSDQVKGAFTGEVSASMLASIGVEYVIVGHSERRTGFNESDQMIAEKIDRASEADLIPIFCCGESLADRKGESHFDIVEKQLNRGLFHLSAARIADCIIAYEPVWAIGTGETATPSQAQEMHAFIRAKISDKYSEAVSALIPILYGGSVTSANAGELFRCNDVDGALVGGSSLKYNEFLSIIRTMNSIIANA
jgi:triosephosphate isomerase (TIM)